MNEPVSAARRSQLLELGCGRALGRYVMLRRIAIGGMAEVFLAVAPDGREVAIKKILPRYSFHQRFVDMLIDEARITVSLNHPNIARVVELGRSGGDYFLVMEYVEGPSLNRLLQRVLDNSGRPLEPGHVLVLLERVAEGLYHAHQLKDPRGRALGLVHRDVSPQNILLTAEGDVKLIDFGIAQARGRLNQTDSGVIRGKLRYLAPEIVMGLEPDHRADVFCCGILLYELLSGKPMYRPETDVEALELAAAAQIAPLRELVPELPRAMEQVVMRCLSRDPAGRPQSAWALAEELRRLRARYAAHCEVEDLGALVREHFSADLAEAAQLSELAHSLLPELRPPTPEPDEATVATVVAHPVQRSLGAKLLSYWPWALGAVGLVMLGFVGMMAWTAWTNPRPRERPPSPVQRPVVPRQDTFK